MNHEEAKDWAAYIAELPALIEHLRKYDANGSFAAADLLAAANFILTHPKSPEAAGIGLGNGVILNGLALRLKQD